MNQEGNETTEGKYLKMKIIFQNQNHVFRFMLALAFLLLINPAFSYGGRCGTCERIPASNGALPLQPELSVSRQTLKPIPLDISNDLNILYSEHHHFRIIWGNFYDRNDPDWVSDRDGVPMWPKLLAEYLESAYCHLTSLGFPAPYGSDAYYLDVYIDNTGASSINSSPFLSSNVFATTKINSDSKTAYFIFQSDFSMLTSKNETDVLQATAAHELFHAIQRVYYPWDDADLIPDPRWFSERWWFEATSTWIEEVCAPQSDDYIDYVQLFLSRPEKSLFTSNGIHEYGASIFPGFLWLRYSNERIWKLIFSTAYPKGIEEALQAGVQAYANQTLPDAIADFWAMAAQPEVLWEDGASYYLPSTPKILQTVSEYPAYISPYYFDYPERFGANLYRIRAMANDLKISFMKTDISSSWRIAAADKGSDKPQMIALKDYEGFIQKATSSEKFLSVVNTSDTGSGRSYRMVIYPPESNDTADDKMTDGGGGGCFINAVMTGSGQK